MFALPATRSRYSLYLLIGKPPVFAQVGMRQGGIRTLIVPPKLGYGKKGSGALVPPDSTLRFEIELLDITDEDRAGLT